jgi:hypothetical protein
LVPLPQRWPRGRERAGADQASAEADPLVRAVTSAAAENKSKEYEATTPFKTKLEELSLKLAERLLTRCFLSAGEVSTQQCAHDRLLAGFDTDGMAERHCPLQTDMEAEFNCIALGALGYRLAGKVGEEAMASFDWDDPGKSADRASIQLVVAKLRECMSSGSASDPSECLVERIMASLELSKGDIDPCDAVRDDDYQYGQCIGEAFAYKFTSAAIARM